MHSRFDIRIMAKECAAVRDAQLGKVSLIVADGAGNAVHEDIVIQDMGRLDTGRLKRVLAGNRRVWNILKKQKKTIVHLHDPELIFAGLCLKLFGSRVILDIHENVPLQILSKHYLPTFIRKPAALAVQYLEWICSFIFDAFVCATPDIAARFPNTKTIIVQNYPLEREIAASFSYASKKTEPAFVYSGGISRIRGALEMAGALKYFDSRACSVKLYLAGKFDPPELESELKILPGWKKIKWLGWIERSEMYRVFSLARAGLLLFHPVENHLGAQPNKMFEYMAAGLPLIASDFPLWRKIIDAEKCGLLVDPRDPKEIFKAMQWVLEHPEKAEAMGKRGRKAVERHYRWDHEAPNLISLYQDIIRNLSATGRV